MIKKPENVNYCATVVEIKNIIPLENCDNIVHTNIFGNLVIVSKEVKVGDIGLFFPPETQLSPEFLKWNNLYRDSTLNADKDKKGYFELNGRIRTVKLRGNKSMGLFIPLPDCLNCLFFEEKIGLKKLDESYLKIGAEYDYVGNLQICQKYIVKKRNLNSSGNKKGKKSRDPKSSKLIDNQFKLHIDTSQLGKNIHRVHPDDLISVTSKLHGSSIISSNILVKRKLNWFEKFFKIIGIKVQETEYENIYSSRRVIKNQYYNDKEVKHYYNVDIWGLANNRIKDTLFKNMTYYGEIVGYLPTNAYIQKNYDYGCDPGTFDVYVYRITSTNVDGKVVEWSAKMVQDWCKLNELKAVPELYYGYAKHLFRDMVKYESLEQWQNSFLEYLIEKFTDKDCSMCKNKVPEEGIVLRIEGMDLEVYKLKSFRFLNEETKSLDKGESDIESEN